jgi:hypothetical protein
LPNRLLRLLGIVTDTAIGKFSRRPWSRFFPIGADPAVVGRSGRGAAAITADNNDSKNY